VAIPEVVVGGKSIGSLKCHQFAEDVAARLRVAKPQMPQGLLLKLVQSREEA